MVRTAFAPKSIENQFVKNMVWYPNVLEDIVLGDDFDPSSTPYFYVAACRDGRMSEVNSFNPGSTENLQGHLNELFEHWFRRKGRQPPRIIVEDFSFSRDDAKYENWVELLESKIRERKSHRNHEISKPSNFHNFSISLRACFLLQ